MNAKELAYVALKIAGIYCFILCIKLIKGIILSISVSDQYTDFNYGWFFSSLIPFLLFLALTILFLWRTDWALQMLNMPVEMENGDKLRIQGFMQAAFAVLGIVLLVDGLTKAIWIPEYINSHLKSIDPLTGNPFPIYLSVPLYRIFEVIFKVGLGLYLFLGGDGLIKFWKRYRDKKVLID